MAYTSEEARTQLLGDIAEAADRLGFGLASASEAYDELDEQHADALEEYVFRPVQGAYGRLRRTHQEFAARVGQPERTFPPPSSGLHSSDPRVYIERAIDAAERADQQLAELQDSLLPVEVGDAELRAGLTETRELIARVPTRGRQLLRTVGR
jgi:hypothetical protein